eukprot:979038-Prorocentrum_minimum.AAC.1
MNRLDSSFHGRPRSRCAERIPDRYPLMVLYAIPSSARWLVNLARVPSDAGNACFPVGSCCWTYRRYRLVAVLYAFFV